MSIYNKKQILFALKRVERLCKTMLDFKIVWCNLLDKII